MARNCVTGLDWSLPKNRDICESVNGASEWLSAIYDFDDFCVTNVLLPQRADLIELIELKDPNFILTGFNRVLIDVRYSRPQQIVRSVGEMENKKLVWTHRIRTVDNPQGDEVDRDTVVRHAKYSTAASMSVILSFSHGPPREEQWVRGNLHFWAHDSTQGNWLPFFDNLCPAAGQSSKLSAKTRELCRANTQNPDAPRSGWVLQRSSDGEFRAQAKIYLLSSVSMEQRQHGSVQYDHPITEIQNPEIWAEQRSSASHKRRRSEPRDVEDIEDSEDVEDEESKYDENVEDNGRSSSRSKHVDIKMCSGFPADTDLVLSKDTQKTFEQYPIVSARPSLPVIRGDTIQAAVEYLRQFSGNCYDDLFDSYPEAFRSRPYYSRSFLEDVLKLLDQAKRIIIRGSTGQQRVDKMVLYLNDIPDKLVKHIGNVRRYLREMDNVI